MALTSELFSAILAMDSYNRGYNAGISGLNVIGASLGNATITTDSSLALGGADLPASSYALAYDVSA